MPPRLVMTEKLMYVFVRKRKRTIRAGKSWFGFVKKMETRSTTSTYVAKLLPTDRRKNKYGKDAHWIGESLYLSKIEAEKIIFFQKKFSRMNRRIFELKSSLSTKIEKDKDDSV